MLLGFFRVPVMDAGHGVLSMGFKTFNFQNGC